MAAVFFTQPSPEVMTNAGNFHPIPREVIEQAGPAEKFDFALRYAFKAGIIDAEEYLDSMGGRETA